MAESGGWCLPGKPCTQSSQGLAFGPRFALFRPRGRPLSSCKGTRVQLHHERATAVRCTAGDKLFTSARGSHSPAEAQVLDGAGESGHTPVAQTQGYLQAGMLCTRPLV